MSNSTNTTPLFQEIKDCFRRPFKSTYFILYLFFSVIGIGAIDIYFSIRQTYNAWADLKEVWINIVSFSLTLLCASAVDLIDDNSSFENRRSIRLISLAGALLTAFIFVGCTIDFPGTPILAIASLLFSLCAWIISNHDNPRFADIAQNIRQGATNARNHIDEL